MQRAEVLTLDQGLAEAQMNEHDADGNDAHARGNHPYFGW